MRTEVGIVGAGPAGLVLAHLLHLQGIDSVVLEARSREYVEQRVRAGVLEQGTVDLLVEMGIGDRLQRDGLIHEGIELQFEGERHRIDFPALTGGRTITVYGQQEVVKDLIAARIDTGRPLLFEVEDVTLADLESDSPAIRFRYEGATTELRCDAVAGCDGYHGVCRDARCAHRVHARLPVRLARHPGRGRALQRRADLRVSRARLRPAQHALAVADQALPPVPPGRGSRRVVGRAHLGGARQPPRPARLYTLSGPERREWRAPVFRAAWRATYRAK